MRIARIISNLNQNTVQNYIISIKTTCDITNFKGPKKKFGVSKVCYIESRYIKSTN